MSDFTELLANVKAALEGDSNDLDHEALVLVAQMFGIEWVDAEDLEDPDPSLRSDWVELWTVDGQRAAGTFIRADEDQLMVEVGPPPERKYVEWPFIRSINFPNRGG